MKTPMQKLIEYVSTTLLPDYELPKDFEKKLYELKREEKWVMCAFAERYLDSIPKEFPGVEDVYNATFKTEEKWKLELKPLST